MKKSFLFLGLSLLAVPFVANAEVVTLDLTTATNSAGAAIQYETRDLYGVLGGLKDVMDSTYSADGQFSQIECNQKTILFQHLPSGESYGGTSWEGFTLSKVAADTLNQFACMAKGGLKGEGTPFVIGYYSAYYNNPAEGKYSNLVSFFDPSYPQEVYICQNAYTYNSITNGDSYAKKFTDKDTLSLIIEAYDSGKDALTNKVVYYLAVDGKFNKGWEKVDLSSLGKCDGLAFSFDSTDKGKLGINTPTYFALDGLKISSEAITAIENQTISVPATKRIVNGVLVIERNGILYNAAGQVLSK